MTQREATLSLVKLANKIIELEGKAIATDQTKSEISRLDFDKKVSEAVDKKIKQEKDKNRLKYKYITEPAVPEQILNSFCIDD